jgi:hypothetical protein
MPYAVILLRPRVSRPWRSASGTWERYPAPTSPTTLPTKITRSLRAYKSRPSVRLTIVGRPKAPCNRLRPIPSERPAVFSAGWLH